VDTPSSRARAACDIGGDCLARYFVRGSSKPRLSAIVNASRAPESEEPADRPTLGLPVAFILRAWRSCRLGNHLCNRSSDPVL